jgi:hypothetical protein
MKWRRRRARGRDVIDIRGGAPKGGAALARHGIYPGPLIDAFWVV